MAKEKFARNKPHCNIGTIGHVDHGKTTLTAAITMVLAKSGGATVEELRGHRRGAGREGARDHDQHGARGVRDEEPPLRARRLPRARRLREEHDHRRGADGRRDPGGVRPPTARCRRPASTSCWPARSGVPALVVYLNKVDMVDDPELLELVEMEVRELLSTYEFPGDDIPIVKGSALAALEGRDRADRRGVDHWS